MVLQPHVHPLTQPPGLVMLSRPTCSDRAFRACLMRCSMGFDDLGSIEQNAGILFAITW